MTIEEIINKIKELNEIKSKIKIDDDTDSLGISINTIQSLKIIDEIERLAPDKKIRKLLYEYVNFLNKEKYLVCDNILKEIKKQLNSNGQ